MLKSVMPPRALNATGRREFAAKAPIPSDQIDSVTEDVARWGELLVKWNAKINLVAPGTIDDFWIRHALDSAQILPHISNDAEIIADFGSGAGFPGVMTAIAAKAAGSGRHVHLMESVGKKASFLRTVARELELPATVHNLRIEAVDPIAADVITARAFAPLPRLLPMADRHLKQGGTLVLPKGASLDSEVHDATLDWAFALRRAPSVTDDSGQIAILTGLQPR